MRDKRDDWDWPGAWGKRLKWVNIDRNTMIKLGLLAGLGVLLLVVGNLMKPSPNGKAPAEGGREAHPTGTAVPVTGNSYQMNLEAQLANTLAQIKGAGEVVVQVSLEGGSSISYATNSQQEVRTSEEKDPTGSTRTSQETRSEAQVVMAREGGSERPVVAGETLPVVRGVLVVATGARDPSTKERLAQAVQVLLGLPAHKVMVLEREEK
ncbi:MAG: stage sporulation protein [Bacillota bacterium]|jgi:stage III sporulation protein AG|nr:stage sporulation protein [Bacillota bacterium]MDK2924649.1 stage sporulation protein [Bacillota bacterium]